MRPGFRAALLAIALTTLGPAAFALADGPPSPRKVAILVHEGVELLDFAGPAEVFSSATVSGRRAFQVFTVAPSRTGTGQVRTQNAVTVVPDYSIADCPAPDILVIPGGNTLVLLDDPATMSWIGERARSCEITLTVCTGAFTLARLGLLDGQSATTHWSARPGLRRDHPKVEVMDDVRFVDSGSIITSAGVSAGIDGSLHVIERLHGTEAAWSTARYMEYEWEPAPIPESERTPAAAAKREAIGHEIYRRTDRAAEAWKAYLKEQPDDGAAYERLGRVLTALGRHAEAEAAINTAIEKGAMTGSAYAALARAQLGAENPSAAATNYEKAVSLGQADSTTLYNLACSYALTQRPDQAIDALTRSLDAGFRNRELLRTDTDLDSIRSHPKFQELAGRLGP
jgi:transcriptional regulator GlxA family with amidase domain